MDLPHQDGGFKNGKEEKSLRSLHEKVNMRLRHFNILKNIYRHDLSKHQKVFYSVAVIVQLEIEN